MWIPYLSGWSDTTNLSRSYILHLRYRWRWKSVKLSIAPEFGSGRYDKKIRGFMLIQEANKPIFGSKSSFSTSALVSILLRINSVHSSCFFDSYSASILNIPGMELAVNQLWPVQNGLSFTVHFTDFLLPILLTAANTDESSI